MATLEVKCAECGNDGTEGSLYLTIDAKYRNGEWELEEREDDGGMELDCLECDHRTPFSTHEGEVPFPYGMTFKPGYLAVQCRSSIHSSRRSARSCRPSTATASRT